MASAAGASPPAIPVRVATPSSAAASAGAASKQESAVRCFAVIGKNNNPLFLKAYDSSDHLKYNHLVHMALDIVEEKYKPRVTHNSDLYLGFLCPVDDNRIYGYVTNTHVKLILVIQDVGSLQDSEIKALFGGLHTTYVNLMCNPFAKLDAKITSTRFAQDVDTLVQRHGEAFARKSLR